MRTERTKLGVLQSLEAIRNRIAGKNRPAAIDEARDLSARYLQGEFSESEYAEKMVRTIRGAVSRDDLEGIASSICGSVR